jgi:putative ABC transport system permease protein
MRLLESLRVAFAALTANRLRSALTILGIVIGVAAVIALVSFGQSYQRYVTSSFQRLGANLITVMPATPGGPNARNLKAKPLAMNDPANVSGVVAVVPEYSVSANATANANSLSMGVTGTIPIWPQVRNWNVADGQFFSEDQVNSSAYVAVLRSLTVSKLFDPGTEPVGQLIRINSFPFRVIGVLETKGGFGNADQVVIIPITTAQTRLAATTSQTADGSYTVTDAFVQVDSQDNMATVQTQLQQLLTARHQIRISGQEDFRVINQQNFLSAVDNITNLLTLFLGVIAGISLLVGGIGVMNIMLVSVTERTREIGLRKAVGARYFDLMFQFLSESIALCLGGGLVGILVGGILGLIGARALPTLNLEISPLSVVLATGVSTAIGVFFGLYPASRAASLDPIEALRYE